MADASPIRIARVLGPDLADDLEDLSSVARTIGAQVKQAAPGIIKGAATGFLTGGPAGALMGAVGGGLASSGVLGGGAASPGAPAAFAAQAGQPIANPAALQLLLTLLRPEVVDALIAMVLGRNGAPGVQIAGQAVPVAAVTNLIQSLAENAAAAHHAQHVIGGVPRYLADARRRGEDITDPDVRSLAVLELIHDAWDDELAEDDEDIDEEIDEGLDAEDIYPGELDR